MRYRRIRTKYEDYREINPLINGLIKFLEQTKQENKIKLTKVTN